MRWIIAGLLFAPVAFSQSTSLTLTLNGTAQVSLNTQAAAGTVSASGGGTLAPLGASNVSLVANLTSNPGTIAGTSTFTLPLTGSFVVKFSAPYSGAATVNLQATVSSGTGIFSNSSGTFNLIYTYTKTASVTGGSIGTFTLTGTGTL